MASRGRKSGSMAAGRYLAAEAGVSRRVRISWMIASSRLGGGELLHGAAEVLCRLAQQRPCRHGLTVFGGLARSTPTHARPPPVARLWA